MPLKLNVGLSRKVGEPNFGSRGASVHLELELDSALVTEPDRLRDRIRSLFQLVRAAVDEELRGLPARRANGRPDSPAARPSGTILAVEEPLWADLGPETPPLLARVDLLTDSGQALWVTDLKTARSRWTADHAQQAADQLVLYAHAARQLVPARRLRLQLVVLTKTRHSEVQTLPLVADPHQLQRARHTARTLWQAIRQGHFYPAPSPVHCPTCPFQEPCQHWPDARSG